MKYIRSLSKQYLLIIIFIVCSQAAAISQERVAARRSITHLVLSFSVVPSQSGITNSGTASLSKLLSSKKSAISGSMELTYLFSKYMGFSTGLGYSAFSSQLSLDSLSGTSNLVDSEKESYQLRVKGSKLSELQNVSFLTIPVYLHLQLPVTHRASFYLQTGLNVALPLTKKYSSSGTFTYTSYYQTYNVLLKDLPVFGLVSNKKIDSDGTLELKPVSLCAALNTGFQYFISSKIQIGAALNYTRSLSSISKYSSPDKFLISADPGLINSMMGGSTKATVQAIGLKISFRIYLN